MNKDRRARIDRECERLAEANALLPEDRLSAMELLSDIQFNVEQVLDEEQEAYDNMPENLQYSDRGCISEECIDALEEAVSSLEELTGLIGSEVWDPEAAEELVDDIDEQFQTVIFS